MIQRPWMKVVAATAAALLAFAACDDGEDDAVDVAVEIDAYDFYFEPAVLLLEPGAEVTLDFENFGDAVHSFTAPDIDVEVEAISGEQVEATFTVPQEPGTFEWYCQFHPDEMEGVATIGGEEEPVGDDDRPDDDDEGAVEEDELPEAENDDEDEGPTP